MDTDTIYFCIWVKKCWHFFVLKVGGLTCMRVWKFAISHRHSGMHQLTRKSNKRQRRFCTVAHQVILCFIYNLHQVLLTEWAVDSLWSLGVTSHFSWNLISHTQYDGRGGRQGQYKTLISTIWRLMSSFSPALPDLLNCPSHLCLSLSHGSVEQFWSAVLQYTLAGRTQVQIQVLSKLSDCSDYAHGPIIIITNSSSASVSGWRYILWKKSGNPMRNLM